MNEPLWTPRLLGAGVLIDDTSPITTVGGRVQEIENFGLVEGSFSAPAGTNRPEIVEAALNGRRALRFDGLDDGLINAGTAARSLYTNVGFGWVFFVARKRGVDASASRIVFFTGVPSGATRYNVGVGQSSPNQNKHYVAVRRLDSIGTVVVPGTAVGDNWFIRRNQMSWATNTFEDYVNGVLAFSGAPLPNSGLTSNTLAPDIRIGSPNVESPDVDLACLIAGSGLQPSNEDWEKLEGWAAHRYGLTGVLPIGHPYKTDPPTFSVVVSSPHPTVIQPATDAPHRYDQAVVPHPITTRNLGFDQNARGRIVGTVKRKDTPSNVPLKRRVRLYRDIDGLFIAETWSDDAGNFVFEHIEEGMAYTTIAYDYQHTYRAVAADNLTLANGSVELM